MKTIPRTFAHHPDRNSGTPSTTRAVPPAIAAPDPGKTPEAYTYRLVQSSANLDLDELEQRGVSSVEIMILWGTNVLYVAHLTPPRDFFVGEETHPHLKCDYFLPAEKLGTSRLPVLYREGDTVRLVIPPGARGSLELAGRASVSVHSVAGEPVAECNGARSILLPAGAKARLEIADFVLRVATVNAAKRLPTGLASGFDWSVPSFFGVSTLVHAGLLACLAFFVPDLGLVDDETSSGQRSYLVQQYLEAASLREQTARPSERTSAEQPVEREGGTGQRAMGEEGRMGGSSSLKNHRYAVRGDQHEPAPRIGRDELRKEARAFGMIGILAGASSGEQNTPTAPWARDASLGTDEVSARGNMWGDDLGESVGTGGLGLAGIGEGGGGYGAGIGLGNVGTIGHGAGAGVGQGFGNGTGRLGRGHTTRSPSVRLGPSIITGRLPPEVIQRIVRQNFGRFRQCYEQGLVHNPSLEGRVAVRFVISRGGAVMSAANGGSDLPDSRVVECVVRTYYGLSFPEPDGGIVTVVYPIMFAPG